MKLHCSRSWFLFVGGFLVGGAMTIGGCHKSYPDEKGAVTSALKSNNDLSSVDVSQDRDKGTMTLSGKVPSDSDRQQADSLAKQAAPDYAIVDEIGVRPQDAQNAGSVDSNLDSGIEANFKAAIKANTNLDDQSIHDSVKNGTIVITGSVKTESQKSEVTSLAQQIPHVRQVVNELAVEPNKNSSPNP